MKTHPRRFTVHVTAEHIREGKRADCRQCAIALAIKEQTYWWPVWVGAGKVLLANFRQVANLPFAAREFIRAVDDKRPVDPISFQLSVTDQEHPRS